MRLDEARLCMDCEEIHDEQECPTCGSEAFAFVTRWVTPAETSLPRRTVRATAAAPASRTDISLDQLDAWRRIVKGTPAPRGTGRFLARGLFGLAAMGLAGWAWTKAGREVKPEEGS